MSDTPRTDFAFECIRDQDSAYGAQPVTNLCRKLERELAAANRRTKEHKEAKEQERKNFMKALEEGKLVLHTYEQELQWVLDHAEGFVCRHVRAVLQPNIPVERP